VGVTIDERNLRFHFSDLWSRVKRYDDHPDYRGAMQKLQGTSALDFVAIQGEDGPLFLIEVKDYRSLPIKDQEDILNGDLPAKVGRKVRDTIAGIIAAHHRGRSDEWATVIKRMTSPDPSIRVLLWIESDFPAGPDGRPDLRLSVLTKGLKRQLRWLTPQVLVVSLASNWVPEGLTVIDLRGKVQD